MLSDMHPVNVGGKLEMMRVRATDPRPCPKCGKIYRSAHTLRTHMEVRLFIFLEFIFLSYYFSLIRTSTPCARDTAACCAAPWPSPATLCTRT